jgi:thioredoxin 1
MKLPERGTRGTGAMPGTISRHRRTTSVAPPLVIISVWLTLALFFLAGCGSGDVGKASSPTVIDFYSDLCMPCQQMDPILEKAEEEFGDRVTVRRVDIDQDSDLADRYRVVYIPTYVFLNSSGEEIDRSVGLLTEQELREKFESLATGR